MKPQKESAHYFDASYDTKERFISYWHQINEIIALKCEKILEIGVGSGFVSKYLKERGVDIVTLDVDERLKPDYTGSVLNMPFPDDSFDIVACYEVLEHLPYESVPRAFSEISRVSKQYAIFSLPDANKCYRLYLKIPKLVEFKKLIPIPNIRKPIHKFDGQHYWEIGKAGYPLARIVKDAQIHGLLLIKTYRVYEWPYHRFFVLKKRNE